MFTSPVSTFACKEKNRLTWAYISVVKGVLEREAFKWMNNKSMLRVPESFENDLLPEEMCLVNSG